MLAIMKREVKSYFQNVLGWLFIAALVAVYGIYFFAYNLQGGYPYVSYALSGVSFILLIAVPILSMRCLAEERKTKVDQLLLTAPVTVGKIVLAKYLALVFVFTLGMLIVGVTPLILSSFGTVPLGESFTALIGFWLLGCVFLAVGLFISSITESQVIAAVLSFVALFLGYMMNSLVSMITETDSILAKILLCFDLYTPFEGFLNGCLDLTSAFYYVSVSAFMVFLAAQSIQKRRWSMSKNTISTGVFSTTTIVVVLAIVVVANMAVSSLPVTITEIDCTYGKMYDLSEQTEEFLANLEEDITIYVLSSEEGKDVQVDETLERYEALSKHVTVEYVDPSINPSFYKEYTDTTPSTNSVIVVGSQRSKVIDYYDLYELEYSYDYYSYSYTTQVTGYDAEGQITSGIEYVTMDFEELAVVYQISGHGETELSSAFTECLEKANIRLETLTLFNEDAVPEDAQAIIIHAPTTDFNENDAKKVIDYLEAGGNAIITCDYTSMGLENFDSILQAYGLDWVDGIVAENDRQYYYSGNPFYLLPEVNSTDYTSSIAGSYVLAVYGVGVTLPEDTDTITYESLLETSESSVSKTNIDKITTSEYEDGDIKGPFAIGVAAEKTIDEETTSRLVVLGSAWILTDNTNSMVSGNHALMFTDIMSQMTSQTELSSSVIPIKEVTLSNLTIDTAASLMWALIIVVIVPIAMLGFGIVIWYLRRKK